MQRVGCLSGGALPVPQSFLYHARHTRVDLAVVVGRAERAVTALEALRGPVEGLRVPVEGLRVPVTPAGGE